MIENFLIYTNFQLSITPSDMFALKITGNVYTLGAFSIITIKEIIYVFLHFHVLVLQE